MSFNKLSKSNWTTTLYESVFNILIFQHLVLLCSIISITLFFKRALDSFTPQDPLPEMQTINVEKQKEFGIFATKVAVGILIKNFQTFDLIKNAFIADLAIWFNFDPDQIMLETVSQFSFDNGDILKKSSPDIRINGNRTVAKYDVRVSFKSLLTYKRFPLEDHRVSLVLTNNFTTPAEMFFTTEDATFKIDPNIFIADWLIKDLKTDAGYQEISLNEQGSVSSAPKVQFVFYVEKKGYKDTLIIFIPLYLVTFITAYSFLISFLSSTRSFMASTAIPALLGYRFVLQNLLPQIGYFTTTDYIYLMLLVVSFIILIFQSILARIGTGYFKTTDQSPKTLFYRQLFEKINTFSFVIVNIILSLGTYYFALQ